MFSCIYLVSETTAKGANMTFDFSHFGGEGDHHIYSFVTEKSLQNEDKSDDNDLQCTFGSYEDGNKA